MTKLRPLGSAHKAVFLLALVFVTGLSTPQVARADGWLLGSGMSTARYLHTATLLTDGRVLVTGGTTGNIAIASAEIYDPTSNSWTPGSGAGSVPSMSTTRFLHTATLLTDGRVLVTGGCTSSCSTASAEIYDPASNSWTPASGAGSVPSLSTARNSHTATLLTDGRVLVTGGHTGSVVTASAEIYDPTSNSWTPGNGAGLVPSMSTARLPHSDTADGRASAGDGRVHS